MDRPAQVDGSKNGWPGVVQADRLGERELDASEEVADGALSRQADHEPDDARRGEDPVAQRPDRRKVDSITAAPTVQLRPVID